MANLKKTILPEEWELIKKESVDPACSLSRLFDILRSRRAQNGTQLLNRSWFLAFMMNVCGCKDGKIGTKFRIPVSAEKSKEIPSVEPDKTSVETSEEEVVATQDGEESMSEIISDKTLFVLKWMYHNKTESFLQFYSTGGYMKKMAFDASSELLELGVITKKNPKRFNPFNWEQILRDFPEIGSPLENHPEWKAHHRSNEQLKETVVTNNNNTPTVVHKQIPSTHEKMEAWLNEEKHVNNEITSNEVIDELRRLRSPRPVDEARYFLEKWMREEKVRKVAYTSAYKILSIPTIHVRTPDNYAEQMKRTLGLLPSNPSNPTVVQQPPSAQMQRMDIHKGVFVVRICGKDFEIHNNSNSSVSLNIENEKIVLQVK